MAAFCRFIAGFALVIATLGFGFNQLQWVVPGAALAVAWLLAGQIAHVIDREQQQRDQAYRPPPHA